jgi:hypothetical protein
MSACIDDVSSWMKAKSTSAQPCEYWSPLYIFASSVSNPGCADPGREYPSSSLLRQFVTVKSCGLWRYSEVARDYYYQVMIRRDSSNS